MHETKALVAYLFTFTERLAAVNLSKSTTSRLADHRIYRSKKNVLCPSFCLAQTFTSCQTICAYHVWYRRYMTAFSKFYDGYITAIQIAKQVCKYRTIIFFNQCYLGLLSVDLLACPNLTSVWIKCMKLISLKSLTLGNLCFALVLPFQWQ